MPQRHFQAWLGLILLGFVALSVAYNLSLPLGEANDEVSHFALVRFISREARPPLGLEQAEIGPKGDAAPFYHALVAWTTQPVSLEPLPTLPLISQKSERLLATRDQTPTDVFHTADEHWPFVGVVQAWHLARLLSLPLGVLTLLLVLITLQRLQPDAPRIVLAGAMLVAFLPRFVMSSAAVNDDNLVWPLIAAWLYQLVCLFQGDLRRRRFFLLGAFAGAAALVKNYGLLLLPETVLVLGLLAWRQGWPRIQLRQRILAAVVPMSAIGGGWLLYALWQYNSIAELGLVRGALAAFGDPVVATGLDAVSQRGVAGLALGEVNPGPWLWLLFRTFWLQLLRLDDAFALDNWAYWLVMTTFVGLTLFAMLGWLWPGLRRVGFQWQRPTLLTTFFWFHSLAFFSLLVLRHIIDPVPLTSTAQGRHLYPALIPLLYALVLGWQGWFNRRHLLARWWLPGLAALLLTTNLLVLGFLLPAAYRPYLPLTRLADRLQPAVNLSVPPLAEGLQLRGYTRSADTVPAGTALPVQLFWRSNSALTADYLSQLCLTTDRDEVIACRFSYPLDGRYPTRAWEPDYRLQDTLYVPVPHCLPPDTYQLRLQVWQVDPTSATPTLAHTVLDGVHLGSLQVTAAREATPARWRIGDVRLTRRHQAVTMVQVGAGADMGAALQQRDGTRWESGLPPSEAVCGNETIVSQTFLLDAARPRGTYTLAGDPATAVEVQLDPRPMTLDSVLPHANRLEPPPVFAGRFVLLGTGDHPPAYFPGQVAEMTFVWQARQRGGQTTIGSLHLLDYAATSRSQRDKPLGAPYVSMLWEPGEVVSDTYRLSLPIDLPPGLYNLDLRLYHQTRPGQFDFLPIQVDSQADTRTSLNLGALRVQSFQRAQPPAQVYRTELGRYFAFRGYTLQDDVITATRRLSFDLYWQSLAPTDRNYTVFTQVLGPDGQVWAQQDNQPQANRYPTSAWQMGDRVVDSYMLTLPPDAPPGGYRLIIGMYNPQTGERLPLSSATDPILPNSAILLYEFAR